MKQESSIVTTLKIVFLYILVLILGTFLCAAIYTVYSLCRNMMAGGGLKIFNLGYFLNGINFFSPLVIISSGIVMFLYIIRYSIRKVLPFNVIIIAYVAAWIFLLPLNYTFLNSYQKNHPQTEVEQPFTTDYFRTGKSGAVFYYSSVENGNVADGVCIDDREGNDDVYTFSGVTIPKNEGYSDSLIHKSTGMPWIVELMSAWFTMFAKIAQQAWEAGFLGWLCFSSIGLALGSVSGLCFVSKWRMVNVLMVCITTIGILVLNIMAYTKSFMDPAKSFLEGAMSNLPIKNPLIVLMNILIFVIFSLLGFIMHTKRRKEDRQDSEDPYSKQ